MVSRWRQAFAAGTQLRISGTLLSIKDLLSGAVMKHLAGRFLAGNGMPMKSTTMFSIPPVIRIEIPALEAYLAYLREQEGLQAKIDALNLQLGNSTADLEEASKKEK